MTRCRCKGASHGPACPLLDYVEERDEDAPTGREEQLRRCVERRDYSFCSALYGRGKGADALAWNKFLVWTPFKAEAMERATAYATKRWGPPDQVYVFPRNYVVEARRLLAAGQHDSEGGEGA
jgi:hypothetical protein